MLNISLNTSDMMVGKDNIVSHRWLYLFLSVLVYVFATTHGKVPYQYQISNYVNLISSYDYVDTYSTIDLIPLEDASQVMNITLSMSIFAINDFDEVAGSIEIVSALEMKWFDEMPKINSISFIILDSSEDFFLVSPDMIWTPTIVLQNAVGATGKVGSSQFMATFNMTSSEVTWRPRVIMTASCTPDVTYYPFDKQTCEFVFTPWGYLADEIFLQAVSDEWDISEYEESGEWDLLSTSSIAYIQDGHSYIKYETSLLRKPLYAAFNILLPVLILCGLNSVVFLLPAESGERVGFSITLFLSFMVFLNTVMDVMPRSSSPVSYLCFYLVVMMCNSAGMTLVTVMMMRVYHKPEKSKVPKWLSWCINFINCGCAKLRCCVLMCRCLRDNVCTCKKDDGSDDDGDSNSTCCQRICRKRKQQQKQTSLVKLQEVTQQTTEDINDSSLQGKHTSGFKCKTQLSETQKKLVTDDQTCYYKCPLCVCSVRHMIKRLNKSGDVENTHNPVDEVFDSAGNTNSKLKSTVAETFENISSTRKIESENDTQNKTSTPGEIPTDSTKSKGCNSIQMFLQLFKKAETDKILLDETSDNVGTKNTQLSETLDGVMQNVDVLRAKLSNGTADGSLKKTIFFSMTKKKPLSNSKEDSNTRDNHKPHFSSTFIRTLSPPKHEAKPDTHFFESLLVPESNISKTESTEMSEKSTADIDSLNVFDQLRDSSSEDSDGETISVFSERPPSQIDRVQHSNGLPDKAYTETNHNKVKKTNKEDDTCLVSTEPKREWNPEDKLIRSSITELKTAGKHDDESDSIDLFKQFQDSSSEDSDIETISLQSLKSRSTYDDNNVITETERDLVIDTTEKVLKPMSSRVLNDANKSNVADNECKSGKLIEKTCYDLDSNSSSILGDIKNGDESSIGSRKRKFRKPTGEQTHKLSAETASESLVVEHQITNKKTDENKLPIEKMKENDIPALPVSITVTKHMSTRQIDKKFKKKLTFSPETEKTPSATYGNDIKSVTVDGNTFRRMSLEAGIGRRYSEPDIKNDDKPRRHSIAYIRRKKLDEDNDKDQEEDDDGLNPDVEWHEVGRVLDFFFFLAFLSLQIFLTVVFFIPIATSTSDSEN